MVSKSRSREARIEKSNKGNITRRLIVSFSLLLLIYLLFGLFSLYDIHTITGLTRTIYDHPLVVSNAALKSNVAITKMHRDMKDVVLFTSPKRIQQAVAAVDRQEQIVYQHLDIVRNNILGDEGQHLEKETRTLFDNWRPIREEVIDLVGNGQRDAAAEITIGKGADHVAKLDRKMAALTNYARLKATSFIEKAERTHSRLDASLMFFLVSAVSVSSLIAFITLRATASAEKELIESRQLFVNAIEYAPIGMVLIEPEGKYYKTNQAFSEIIGYSEEELLEMNFQQITHPDDYACGSKIVRQLIEGKIERASLEKRYLKKDGDVVDAYLTISLLRSPGGSPLYLFTQIQDVTARKKAEAKLREARALLQAAMDQSHVGIAIADSPNGLLRYMNDVGLRILGNDRHSNVNGVGIDQYASDWRILDLNGQPMKSDEVPLVRAVKFGETCSREFMIRRTPDENRIVWCNAAPIHDTRGNIIAGIVVFLDNTERKLAEQRVEHLNRVLRAIRDVNQLIVRERDPQALIREACRLLVDNRGYASALIVLTDENNRMQSWAGSGIASTSEALNAMLERREPPSCCHFAQPANEVVTIDDRTGVCGECPIVEACAGTSSLCIRLNHEAVHFGYLIAALDHDMNADAEEWDLFSEMAGDIAYALNFIRMETDRAVSERKRKNLEHQLFQAQKMKSIGQLAGGVAHDYNNMLSVIIGYTELAMEKIETGDPVHADLKEVLDAAMRSTDITKQLLAFARQQTIAPKVLHLNDIVEGMLNMLRRLIGEDIDFFWQPGNAVWPVKIDPAQVSQILANLCVNARDAITGVGKVTVETGNATFDEDYCSDHAGFIPGDYVMLAVSDNGSGMSPETLDKVFEPFFTTKGLGQGTGLGLSTVYGIVKQNNGFLNAYSEPEQGTTIKIYLSRHTGDTVEAYRDNTTEIPSSRGETILLVEDDGSILKMARIILENLGYTVLPATSPSQAKRLAEAHAGEIDLLITDVVMPEMNGRELSEQLHAQYPNIKTLYMSGYTANVIAHRGVLDEGVFFIPKPLSKIDLAVKVREVLDKG